MTAWLEALLSNDSEATTAALGARIGSAFLLGAAVAALYRWARRGESTQATFPTTLVLLAGLIAMATQVIGDNVARAFSLVGALSVVRFRTVVKDTQDTAFVIFAVVVGMSAGAGRAAVGIVGLGVAAAAAPLLWPPGRGDGWRREEAVLTVRIGRADGAQASVESLLGKSTSRCELYGAETVKKGASLELVYHVRLGPGESPTGLMAGLTLLAGVEDVELHRRD